MTGLGASRRVPVLKAGWEMVGEPGGTEVALGSGRMSRGWKWVVSPRLHCRHVRAVHGSEGRSSETREWASVRMYRRKAYSRSVTSAQQRLNGLSLLDWSLKNITT